MNNYAVALNDLTLDQDCLNMKEQLSAFMQLNKDDKFYKLLLDPTIDIDIKENIIKSKINSINNILLSFLLVVIKNKDYQQINNIINATIKLLNQRLNVDEVYIYSAIALTDDYQQQLVNKLQQKLKVTIHPHFYIDESLIGGIKIIYNQQIIDYTVLKQLNQLEHNLKGGK